MIPIIQPKTLISAIASQIINQSTIAQNIRANMPLIKSPNVSIILGHYHLLKVTSRNN